MSDAESAAPQALDPFADTRPKLYSIAAIDLATFLSSWLAGAFLLASNYRRFGDNPAARKALLIGFLSLVALVLVGGTIVVPERFAKAEQFVYQAVQVGVIHLIARRLQGTAIANHKAAGGKLYSRWRAAGIALLLLPVALIVIVAIALLFPGLPAFQEAA